MFALLRPDQPVQFVDADEHVVEAGCHVFRRTTTVMARPRTVVVLRLPLAAGLEVHQRA